MAQERERGGEALRRLEEVEFFRGWSGGAATRAREWVTADSWRFSERHPEWPGLALTSVRVDPGAIEAEGAYSALLREFVAGSFGLLQPREVEEAWDAEQGVVRLACTQRDVRHRATFALEGRWIDARFFALLRRLLAATGLEFHCPDVGWAHDAGFLLASTSGYQRAVEAGLLPEAMRLGPERAESAVGSLLPSAGEWLSRVERLGLRAHLPAAVTGQLDERAGRAESKGRHPGVALAVASFPFDKLRTAPRNWVALLKKLAEKLADLVSLSEPEVEERGAMVHFSIALDGERISHAEQRRTLVEREPFAGVATLVSAALARRGVPLQLCYFFEPDRVHFALGPTDDDELLPAEWDLIPEENGGAERRRVLAQLTAS